MKQEKLLPRSYVYWREKMNNKNIKDIIVNIISKNVVETGEEIIELNMDDKLIDIGLNSLSYVKSIVEIENEFGFEFDDEDLDFREIESIKDIYDKIIEYLDK